MLVVDIDFAVVLEGARLSISAWKCSFIIVIGPFIGEVVSSMFKLAVNKMRISLFESISSNGVKKKHNRYELLIVCILLHTASIDKCPIQAIRIGKESSKYNEKLSFILNDDLFVYIFIMYDLNGLISDP